MGRQDSEQWLARTANRDRERWRDFKRVPRTPLTRGAARFACVDLHRYVFLNNGGNNGQPQRVARRARPLRAYPRMAYTVYDSDNARGPAHARRWPFLAPLDPGERRSAKSGSRPVRSSRPRAPPVAVGSRLAPRGAAARGLSHTQSHRESATRLPQSSARHAAGSREPAPDADGADHGHLARGRAAAIQRCSGIRGGGRGNSASFCLGWRSFASGCTNSLPPPAIVFKCPAQQRGASLLGL